MIFNISKLFGSVTAITLTVFPVTASAIGFCSTDTLEGNSLRELSTFIQETLPSDLAWVCTAENELGETIYVARNNNTGAHFGYTINESGQLCLKLDSITLGDIEAGDELPRNERPPCTLSMI